MRYPKRHSTCGRVIVKTIQLFLGKYIIGFSGVVANGTPAVATATTLGVDVYIPKATDAKNWADAAVSYESAKIKASEANANKYYLNIVVLPED